MNAKANTTATNTPNAKDETKNNTGAGSSKTATNAPTVKDDAATALAEKAAKMTAEDRKALALRVLEGEANEEDQKLFEALKTENMKATAARKVHLDTIIAAVQALAGTSRPFGPDDMQKIFPKELISEVAHSMGLVKDGQAGEGEKKKREGTAKTFASDANPILLQVPAKTSGRTKSPYHQGRVFESHDGTATDRHGKPVPFVNAASAPSILQEVFGPNSLRNLIPAENRDAMLRYLETPKGKEEEAMLIEWAKKHRKAKKIAEREDDAAATEKQAA